MYTMTVTRLYKIVVVKDMAKFLIGLCDPLDCGMQGVVEDDSREHGSTPTDGFKTAMRVIQDKLHITSKMY